MSSSRPLRVALTGELFAFPTGTGATTRVTAIGRGLCEAGAHVHVFPTRYVERDPRTALNTETHGIASGLPFTYTSGTSVRPSTFAGRRWARTRGIGASVTPFTWRTPPDAVLLFTGHTVAVPLLNRIASFSRRAAMLFDACELPYVYEQDSLSRRMEEQLYTPYFYRVYDGFMVISECLERYFAARSRVDARMIRIPILVDVDRFALAPAGPRLERPYIAYTGALGDSKGILDLVRAFSRVASRFPAVDLALSGSPPEGPYQDRVMRMAADLGIGGRVRMLGIVPNESFPTLLRNATALVMPHPKGVFSDAAFPTKLGEYLASGTPTVATDVGEVGRFVRDDVDVFLVPPDDPEALAARLASVLAGPSHARAVGDAGQRTARREFDYRYHGRRLADFLGELVETRRRPRRAGRRPVNARHSRHCSGPEERL